MAQVTSGPDPRANLDLVAEKTATAAAAGADLVVFPEAMMCRFGVPLAPVAEPVDGPWAHGVGAIAAQHGVHIVAGMFTPADRDHSARGASGRVANTLVCAAPDGALDHYDKIHLYDAYGFAESDTVVAGDTPVTITVGDTVIGLATCYDIRFPALFTALARRGAQIIVVPASWGAGPGKVGQWEVLARARALDSASVIAAVGQACPERGRDEPDRGASSAPTGVGHSMLVDPFGSVVVAYGPDPHLGVHEVDLSVVAQARAALAVLDNARDIGP